MQGTENRRLAFKRHLAEMIKQNPDLDRDKIVALFSTKTGLTHSRIRIYIIELDAEGLI